jgi:hypothetical protein
VWRSLQTSEQLFGRDDGVNVGRSVDGVGRVHRLMAEGGGGVPDQRDVISELHAEAVDSMQVLAIMPNRMISRTPCCSSCRSRSVLAKPLDPQCSWTTTSPGWGWKLSWNVLPQLSLAKICVLAPASCASFGSGKDGHSGQVVSPSWRCANTRHAAQSWGAAESPGDQSGFDAQLKQG